MKSKVIKIQGITGEMPLIAISGLPGLGAVGINAASLFVSEGSSVLISQILIKSSSSNLIVSENGVVSPSAFNVYYVTSKDFLKPILVLLGSFQSQNAVEQYKLAETFLNLAKKLRIRYVFSLGGFQTLRKLKTRNVFIVPNDLMTLRLSVVQGLKLASGQITGAAGLIAGLSKYYGFKGGVLLAETNGQVPDNIASQLLHDKLLSLINKVSAS
ncbi:PAC2 family protein [archaeon]|jgi:proteasome assembly chaperone (PAC2) family protein|nr:PAC2 family protein [archaeon]NHV06925.1 hypothetical protein [Nitrososphaerota archaeon]